MQTTRCGKGSGSVPPSSSTTSDSSSGSSTVRHAQSRFRPISSARRRPRVRGAGLGSVRACASRSAPGLSTGGQGQRLRRRPHRGGGRAREVEPASGPRDRHGARATHLTRRGASDRQLRQLRPAAPAAERAHDARRGGRDHAHCERRRPRARSLPLRARRLSDPRNGRAERSSGGAGGRALYNVAVLDQNIDTSEGATQFGGLTATPLPIDGRDTAALDLRFLLEAGRAGPLLTVEYRTDLFERSTADDPRPRVRSRRANRSSPQPDALRRGCRHAHERA